MAGAVIAVMASAQLARAEVLFEAGAGAPGGVTVGLGARVAGWQAVGEVGGAAAAFVGMLSGSIHLHRDVYARGRLVLAAGASATHLGWLAGSDEMVSGTVDTIGPTLQLRYARSRRTELVLDAGPVLGRCRGDCDMRLFVMPAITLRLAVRL